MSLVFRNALMPSENKQVLRLRLVYFMRLLLLAPLILVLSSCGYGSYYEAERACDKWEDAGGTYSWFYSLYEKDVESLLRDCFEEDKTNQILGRVDTSKRKGAYYKADSKPASKWKIIKRFKY